MRPVLAVSVVVACTLVHSTTAFTCPCASHVANSASPRWHAHRRTNAEECSQSLQFTHDEETPRPTDSTLSALRQRMQKAASLSWKRTDTLKAAGLHDDGAVPMQSGFKSNVGWFVAAILFKWYRARYVTKIPIWDRQPQWNVVVTKPEHEKELHAYCCKKCGATIFIARHREWFFGGGNTKCTNCGAKGTENFEDVRKDLLDSIDDDYFDYESPLDFVSAAERRKLVKQAGGDEEKAKQIAIDNVMKKDKTQIKASEEEGKKSSSSSTASSPSSLPGETNKAKNKPVDIFDELDMDL